MSSWVFLHLLLSCIEFKFHKYFLLYLHSFYFIHIQFIVTVRKSDVTVYHQVLSPLTKPPSNAKRLKKWKWGFDPENGHYVGLYPRSWTVYEIPELQLVLVCQQVRKI